MILAECAFWGNKLQKNKREVLLIFLPETGEVMLLTASAERMCREDGGERRRRRRHFREW